MMERRHVVAEKKRIASASGRARAVADLAEGRILASVEVAAAPEVAFRALASKEITSWWVRPGVFDTREWTGEVEAGGAWQASGMAKGKPYTLEGQFLKVDPPRKLVHTWHTVGIPGAHTTVTCLLERLNEGTRITLRHTGFDSREACINTCIGWETSFEKLVEILS